MGVTGEAIKTLRAKTGVSVMQCKKALEEAGGDMDKALIILQKKGSEAVMKKSDRELGAGAIGVYIHNTNEIAASVHLACETDFVSKNEEFVALAREIAMHVAALDPAYIKREDITEDDLSKVKEVLREEVQDKPEDMQEKILEGKIDAYFKDKVLMEQAFIKDGEKTVGDLIAAAVQKFGENIVIAEISRIAVK